MIPVLFIISVVIFLLVRVLPNEPIYSMMGEDSEGLTPEMHAIMMRDLGLDRPLPIQYISWVAAFVTGDWGKSSRTGGRWPANSLQGCRTPSNSPPPPS